eukprot:scaffold131311_cov22-Tisochrysis_lutea.AAC.2
MAAHLRKCGTLFDAHILMAGAGPGMVVPTRLITGSCSPKEAVDTPTKSPMAKPSMLQQRILMP